MKKMLTTKAIAYAKKILNLERVLQDENSSKERQEEAMLSIQKIIDEICENFEPSAMYKVDEQIEILEKRSGC